MDDREITKLADEAFQIYKRIKDDEAKLNSLKDKIVEISQGKNTSYKIKLKGATIRVTKSKIDFWFILNKTDFARIDTEIKKELVKNGIVKVTYFIDSSTYEKFLARDLIPQELKDVVAAHKKKPFSIAFYLDKDVIDEDLIK